MTLKLGEVIAPSETLTSGGVRWGWGKGLGKCHTKETLFSPDLDLEGLAEVVKVREIEGLIELDLDPTLGYPSTCMVTYFRSQYNTVYIFMCFEAS